MKLVLVGIASVLLLATMVTSVEAANVPDWVKNNAEWWANGEIPDSAFVNGIQYLIKEGIMIVS